MMDSSVIKRLQVKEIIPETDDTKSFILEPLDGWDPKYVAGQFLTLVFKTSHGEKRRSYSISSSPILKEPLTITVKYVVNGEFSRWMLQHVREGDVLFSSGISGFFVLNEKEMQNKQVCLLAAGSGITPCFSLIKTILNSTSNKVTLLYSNPSKEKVIFYDSLLKLQKQNDQRFQIRFLFSDHQNLLHKRLSRWLLDQLLVEYLGNGIKDTIFYLCGPFEYMQMAEITLRMYVDKSSIRKEVFTNLERKTIPRPPDTDPHQVSIRIGKFRHQLQVQYPKSILASAKEKGVELPYSCEAGRCGSCVASCTKGKVWMAYNEVLTDKEVEEGRILVCQGFPVGGDAEIEFEII